MSAHQGPALGLKLRTEVCYEEGTVRGCEQPAKMWQNLCSQAAGAVFPATALGQTGVETVCCPQNSRMKPCWGPGWEPPSPVCAVHRRRWQRPRAGSVSPTAPHTMATASSYLQRRVTAARPLGLQT